MAQPSVSSFVREPAVAGYFYPATLQEIKIYFSKLEQNLSVEYERTFGNIAKADGKEVNIAKGFVVPHAGWMYSGWVASFSYKFFERFCDHVDTVILIGPNHRGFGAPVAVWPGGEWKMPVGSFLVDEEFSTLLIEKLKLDNLREHVNGHVMEHSLEVQLPFFWWVCGEAEYFKNLKYVFISMLDQSLYTAEFVGELIAQIAKKLNRRVVVFASSDFSHYEPPDVALTKDQKVIDKILSLDAEGMYSQIANNRVTVCGYGPIAAMLKFSKLSGASRASLLKYATSGDVAPSTEVVGYASIVVE